MKYIFKFFLSTLIIFIYNPVWAEDFKIISFKGVVETSADQQSWNIVIEGQLVDTGTWIRTGPKASATILLPNRTQTKISSMVPHDRQPLRKVVSTPAIIQHPRSRQHPGRGQKPKDGLHPGKGQHPSKRQPHG